MYARVAMVAALAVILTGRQIHMERGNNPLYSINKFFDDYAHAVAIQDSKHIATCFALPCIFIADDKTSAYSTAAKLEGLINQGKRFYTQFDITSVNADVLNKRQLTPRIIKTHVRWSYINSKGKLVYDCDDHYILRLDEHNKWKIETSISINEKERIEALG